MTLSGSDDSVNTLMASLQLRPRMTPAVEAAG
jgi:hypothetical protein